MSDPSNNTPAGWYDDGSGNQRYWDGSAWTEHTAPTTTAGQSATPQTLVAPDQAAPASKPHVVGWVAFATAIAGFIFACIPGALVVGWVLLPIAFVLSLVAFFLKGKKWPAIVGLILSLVGTIVGFVVFFAVVATSFDDAFGGGDTTVSQPEESAPTAEATDAASDEGSAESGSRENPVPLGSVISSDEYDVTINSVTLGATDAVLSVNTFNEAPEEGTAYAIVNATITYTGAESGLAAMVGIDYVTATGEVIGAYDNFVVAPDPALGVDELYTGGTATGNVVLAIPVSNDGALRVRPGVLADEVFVKLQ